MWYLTPMYKDSRWQAVNADGELVAIFEERRDGIKACNAVNGVVGFDRPSSNMFNIHCDSSLSDDTLVICYPNTEDSAVFYNCHTEETGTTE